MFIITLYFLNRWNNGFSNQNNLLIWLNLWFEYWTFPKFCWCYWMVRKPHSNSYENSEKKKSVMIINECTNHPSQCSQSYWLMYKLTPVYPPTNHTDKKHRKNIIKICHFPERKKNPNLWENDPFWESFSQDFCQCMTPYANLDQRIIQIKINMLACLAWPQNYTIIIWKTVMFQKELQLVVFFLFWSFQKCSVLALFWDNW